jgi:hypothetical protein
MSTTNHLEWERYVPAPLAGLRRASRMDPRTEDCFVVLEKARAGAARTASDALQASVAWRTSAPTREIERPRPMGVNSNQLNNEID